MNDSSARSLARTRKENQQNEARAWRRILTRWTAFAAATGAALVAGLVSLTATAATCQFIGGPQVAGIEPQLAVDGTCSDPDYNETTLVIDSTEQKTLALADGTKLAYTEVKGHFPPTRTQADLPAGIFQSPTTAKHDVLWRFPEKKVPGATAFSSKLIRSPADMLTRSTIVSRSSTAAGSWSASPPATPRSGTEFRPLRPSSPRTTPTSTTATPAGFYGDSWRQSGGSVSGDGRQRGNHGRLGRHHVPWSSPADGLKHTRSCGGRTTRSRSPRRSAR